MSAVHGARYNGGLLGQSPAHRDGGGRAAAVAPGLGDVEVGQAGWWGCGRPGWSVRRLWGAQPGDFWRSGPGAPSVHPRGEEGSRSDPGLRAHGRTEGHPHLEGTLLQKWNPSCRGAWMVPGGRAGQAPLARRLSQLRQPRP